MGVDPIEPGLFASGGSGATGWHAAYHRAKAKRVVFLEALKADPTTPLADLCFKANISKRGYTKWRETYPEFAYDVDSVRAGAGSKKVLKNTWKGDFAGFRHRFFGMDSPWFHLEIIDVLEHAAPGSVTLVLLPPGHGKTTLLEDWCNQVLAQDPSHRIGYASEKQMHSKKCLRRIQRRMTRDGGHNDYISRFGPFAPEQGTRSSQPWGSEYFDVRRKRGDDERDYNFVALGIGAAVAGSRFDTVIIDDVQSRKTLNQTQAILEQIRQDFLSRAFGNDPMGRVLIIGTRVGEDDVYQALMDEVDEETGEPLLDRVIKYPAVRYDFDAPDTDAEGKVVRDHKGRVKPKPIYLWPERYDRTAYDKMRRIAGPLAWARNFQQQGFVAGTTTFDDDVLDHALNPLHAWESLIPDGVKELVLSLDPAIGGQNSVTVQGWGDEQCVLLDSQGDWGLTNISQTADICRLLIDHWNSRTRADGIAPKVRTLVVEHMAYQKSIRNDPSFLKLQTDFGLVLTEHQTGDNKNDPTIGITGMVFSMYQGQIMLPAATDTRTAERIGAAVAEFRAWRPNKRGNKLKQDRVMSFWFGWLLWRNRRHTLLESEEMGGPSPFKTQGLPWAPMRTPRMLTSGRSPFSGPGPRRKRRVS